MRVRASNIGKRLNPWGPSTWSDRPPTRRAYMSRRRVHAHIQGRGSDGATRTYLWKAAGIHMPDGRRVIISRAQCHRKIRTLAGRPFGVAPKRRSWDPRLRYAIVQSREKSLDTIHILRRFTRSNPFVSPFVSAGRLHFSPLDATFLPLAGCSRNCRCIPRN